MKGVKTPRPLTHDLFMTIIGVLGASLLRVLIYKAKDGIFYSYIYLKKDEEIIRIDTRTSDAVGMAIRAECPILIYESILEQECLRISNEERRHPEESDEEAEDEKKRDLPRNVTSMSLEEALEQAIKDENYELAAKIRAVSYTHLGEDGVRSASLSIFFFAMSLYSLNKLESVL